MLLEAEHSQQELPQLVYYVAKYMKLFYIYICESANKVLACLVLVNFDLIGCFTKKPE